MYWFLVWSAGVAVVGFVSTYFAVRWAFAAKAAGASNRRLYSVPAALAAGAFIAYYIADAAVGGSWWPALGWVGGTALALYALNRTTPLAQYLPNNNDNDAGGAP